MNRYARHNSFGASMSPQDYLTPLVNAVSRDDLERDVVGSRNIFIKNTVYAGTV